MILTMRLVEGIVLIGVMMLIGVMTVPCETLKADGVGAGQQLGNMLLPVEHACEKGSRWERGKDLGKCMKVLLLCKVLKRTL